MANEITLTAALSATKAGGTVAGQTIKQITMSGTGKASNVQNIGTSSEAITIGDVATIGYLYVRNTDTTNYVSISTLNPAVANTSAITLKAGEAAVLPTRIAAWYAIADTAAVDLEVIAVEL